MSELVGQPPELVEPFLNQRVRVKQSAEQWPGLYGHVERLVPAKSGGFCIEVSIDRGSTTSAKWDSYVYQADELEIRREYEPKNAEEILAHNAFVEGFEQALYLAEEYRMGGEQFFSREIYGEGLYAHEAFKTWTKPGFQLVDWEMLARDLSETIYQLGKICPIFREHFGDPNFSRFEQATSEDGTPLQSNRVSFKWPNLRAPDCQIVPTHTLLRSLVAKAQAVKEVPNDWRELRPLSSDEESDHV